MFRHSGTSSIVPWVVCVIFRVRHYLIPDIPFLLSRYMYYYTHQIYFSDRSK